MHAAIKEAVINIIAEKVRADRQTRQEARRRAAEAEAARVAADPLTPLRERLADIEEQMAKLGAMHRRQGDALARRLIATLERERAEILARQSGGSYRG